jgi:hypothetical protein
MAVMTSENIRKTIAIVLGILAILYICDDNKKNNGVYMLMPEEVTHIFSDECKERFKSGSFYNNLKTRQFLEDISGYGCQLSIEQIHSNYQEHHKSGRITILFMEPYEWFWCKNGQFDAAMQFIPEFFPTSNINLLSKRNEDIECFMESAHKLPEATKNGVSDELYASINENQEIRIAPIVFLTVNKNRVNVLYVQMAVTYPDKEISFSLMIVTFVVNKQ